MTAKELKAAADLRAEKLAAALNRQQLSTLKVQMETAEQEWKTAKQEFDLSRRSGEKALARHKEQIAGRMNLLTQARDSVREQSFQLHAARTERQAQWRSESRLLRRSVNNDRISAVRRMNAQTLVRNTQQAAHGQQMHALRGLNQQQMLAYRQQLFAQKLTNGRALHTQKLAQRLEAENQRQLLRGSRGGGGSGGSGGGGRNSFGGFAHGNRQGVLGVLGSLGPGGVALGWGGLVAEASLKGFTTVLEIMTAMGVAAAAVTYQVGKWYAGSIGFNQQANGILDALAGGNAQLAKGLGDYLRRDVARMTPFSTRETLLITPKFMSMGKNLSEADFLTQLTSDIAFGLNPNDPTRATHLTEKLIGDIISKGRMQAEEGRQAANLGIPMAMFRQKVFEDWNSAEFQKANPTAGKLRNVGEVMKKISSGEVGPNMAINAIAAVSNQRLRRDRVGEYSQWATENTIGGLMSQLESLPVEVADIIAQKRGGSADKLMSLLRGSVPTLGSESAEARIALGIDRMVSAVLGFGTGFNASFRGFDFLTDIRTGVEAFNWEEFGKFGAESINWVGVAFKGFMLALEDARPRLQSIFGGLMKFFDTPDKVRATAAALIDLVAALTDLGAVVIKVLATLAPPVAVLTAPGKALLHPLDSLQESFKGNPTSSSYWKAAGSGLGVGVKTLFQLATPYIPGVWGDVGVELGSRIENDLAPASVDPNLGSRLLRGSRAGARAGAVSATRPSVQFGDINIRQNDGEDSEQFAQRVVTVLTGELRGVGA